MSPKIVLLPGDGIGPEVTAEASLLIQAVARQFDLTLGLQTELIGGAAIDATGEPLPQKSLDACRDADAIILGAVGGPNGMILIQKCDRSRACWQFARSSAFMLICARYVCIRAWLMRVR